MKLTHDEQAKLAKELRRVSLYYTIRTEQERKERIKYLRWYWQTRHQDEFYGFYKGHAKEAIKHYVKELRCADYTIAQEKESWVNALVIGYQAASSGTSCEYQRRFCYKSA